MNWTGGTRARATKSSSATTRIQKRYFAKARAAMQSFALPSSQTGLPISQKRKRQVTPEFDVVVKKKAQPDEDNSQECASPYFNSPAEGGGKDGGGSKDGKREKTKREMLLERDDWVCTALSQPLVMRRGPSRLSVLGQDDSSDRGWNDEETSPPAEDQASDSGGDVDDNGDGGGYDDVGGGAEEVLGGDDYSGGIEAGDEDEDEGEHIPVGDGNGYTKLDGGGYVQIGGPARRAPTPQPRSWGPPGILRHKDSREGSEDTMLLDFDIKERPIFHYNHITPTIPKCVERWLQARQTNEGSGGYSSSPLAAYSRRRGHRIPSSRCGDPDILGKSSVRGAEGMPSITESSPLIVHAQLGSDPFRRSEPRASPRPKSRFNFWKGPSKGNPTAERYHSENESNAVSYVPGWGRSSQGTPFVTSTLGSPCPGSKPRILSQTKDPVEAVDEILRGEEDIQWERFVRDSPVGDVAGGAHLPCTDTAGAIRGTNSESNRDSKSKEIELRSFNDWYDFNKYTRANCPLEPNEEHIAPISHNALCGEENSSNTSRMMENAADNRASWAEFLAAPLESDGPESPGEPPKRIPDIGPPQASGAPPYRKSAVLDAEIPKGRVEKKLKVLDEINMSTQEDRLWEEFVYDGFSDDRYMESKPNPQALYTGQKEAAASPNRAVPRGRESHNMVARCQLVGGPEGKQPIGELGGFLRPEPEVAFPPGGSAPKRQNRRLSWPKKASPGERMERES